MQKSTAPTEIAAQETLLPKKSKFQIWCKNMKGNYPFLIFLFPAILIVFLFNYLPIYGVLIDRGNYFGMFASWVVVSLLSIVILLGQKPLRKEE